jgi:metallo-beta-lactamase class B
MKQLLFLCAISIILYSCKYEEKSLISYESETLKIKEITKDVFIHISYLKTTDFGNVACNGLIYFNNDEAIVFDTPTDNSTSKELINWIQKEQNKNIKVIVATHFHSDCLGGLQAFHTNGTSSYASKKTIKLAKENNVEVLPEFSFEDEMKFKIGTETASAKFFGEGHTSDNIVGHIPNKNTLFGGCLIKSVNASKGYLGDANTAAWSKTVAKLKIEIPDLKIIIPGHGENGGMELLDYTIELFNK